MTKNLIKLTVLLACSVFCCELRSVSGQEAANTYALRLDKTNPDSPAVYYNDQLITQYIPKSTTKPIFFPLQTISGKSFESQLFSSRG